MSPALVAVVRRSVRILCWATAVQASIVGALGAQARLGAIAGTVKDDLGAPIANVEVSVPSVATVRTDSVGKFLLASLPPGNADVSFRRLAFSPIVLAIVVPRDDTTEVDVTLTVVAQKLKGVVTQEDAPHLRQLDAFEARRKQGMGHFITRGQIEKRNPMLLSDMMRSVPGALLIPDGYRSVLRFARNGRTSCPPQYFVDGVQVTGYNIDDMPVGDVEGIELYSGASTLPPEFNKYLSTVSCGAVIIWTRIPGG